MINQDHPGRALLTRLALQRRTAVLLAEQRRLYQSGSIPAFLHQQQSQVWQTIESLKRDLRSLGVVIDDLPEDGEWHPLFQPFFSDVEFKPLLVRYTAALLARVENVDLHAYAGAEHLRPKLHTVYLDLPLLTQQEAPSINPGSIAVPRSSSRSVTQLADELLAPQARVLVSGQAGAGKSMLLRWLVFCSAHRFQELPALDRLPANWPEPAPIPLLLERADIAAHLLRDAPPIDLWHRIVRTRLARDGVVEAEAMLRQALALGRCLIVIDDFDDYLAAEELRRVHAMLGYVLATYPENRFLLACRARNASEGYWLNGFAYYELQPLSAELSDLLSARWYHALARLAGDAADEIATAIPALQAALHSRIELRELLLTPRLLVAGVLAALDGLSLAQDLGGLAQRIVDLLLRGWLEHGLGREAFYHPGTARFHPAQLVQPLALALHAQLRLASTPGLEVEPVRRLLDQGLESAGARVNERLSNDLLRHCLRCGLLQHQQEWISMPLAPLRAFLAARALATQPAFVSQAFEWRHDLHWRPVVLQAIGLISRRPGAQVARALLRKLIDASDAPLEQARNLILAAECLLELGARAGPVYQMHEPVKQGLLETIEGAVLPLRERIQAGLLLGRLGDPRTAELMPALMPIPAGAFMMGRRQGGYEDEGPPLRIEMPEYAIGRYPVTNREYARFLQAEADVPRPRYWHDPRLNNPSQPVVGITWFEARRYCAWLNATLHAAQLLQPEQILRLPAEAEWEKAAAWDYAQNRARLYPWGEAWQSAHANTADGRGEWLTTPIGCYPAGVSAYGVHDMIGNVWEWTASEYASYPGAARPFREPGSYVLRGSSCQSLPVNARCTYRSKLPAGYWRYHLGFRVAVGAPLPEATALSGAP